MAAEGSFDMQSLKSVFFLLQGRKLLVNCTAIHIRTSLNVKSSDHNNVILVYEDNLTVAMRMSINNSLVLTEDE